MTGLEKFRKRPHPMSDYTDASGAITVAVTGNKTQVFIDHEKAGVLPGGSFELVTNTSKTPTVLIVRAPNPETLVSESGFTEEDFPYELEWSIPLELKKDA
jgi:hypothetical protein